MKSIIFDTGPIISLTLNNILWILESLHEKFEGEFYITRGVYDELINKPLSTKKYKFEALQVLPLITKGILKINENPLIQEKADYLLSLANNCFEAHGNYIKAVHRGEMEAVACALVEGSSTLVIDERTTRDIIENPELLERRFERKLHTNVNVHHDNMKRLSQEIGHLKVIRSFELATVAFELGLLNMFTLKEQENVVPNIRRAVLEGVLWGLKLSGCSVKKEDIYEVLDSDKVSDSAQRV